MQLVERKCREEALREQALYDTSLKYQELSASIEQIEKLKDEFALLQEEQPGFHN